MARFPAPFIYPAAGWSLGLVNIRGRGETEVDVFRHNEHMVWGLTERVLANLMEKME